MTATGQITALVHYPVKGLSGQTLPEVTLSTGQGFPFDRMFGFARAGSGFDPADPAPMPKDRFLMLMRDERLAGLASHFDPVTRMLELQVQGRSVFSADLSKPQGCTEAETFFARMFDLAPDKMPRFVHAAPHRFTDVSVVSTDLMNAVSLINLDSIADLEAKTGAAIAPERFRANILFRGWPAFSELSLEGREMTIGSARARVTLRTRRCAATEVNPVTAKRDLPIPRLLHQHYGHSDMGIYAELMTGAVIRPGDIVSVT
jgi:uncharacterized protein YcbX